MSSRTVVEAGVVHRSRRRENKICQITEPGLGMRRMYRKANDDRGWHIADRTFSTFQNRRNLLKPLHSTRSIVSPRCLRSFILAVNPSVRTLTDSRLSIATAHQQAALRIFDTGSREFAPRQLIATQKAPSPREFLLAGVGARESTNKLV